MRRIAFFMNVRSGSSTLRWLLSRGEEPDPPEPSWLATVPEKQCLYYTTKHPSLVDMMRNHGRVLEVPEAYALYFAKDWGKEWFRTLPGEDWKYIFLLRDPRNQIESARSKHVKFCEGRGTSPNPKFLQERCEVWKQKAENIVSVCEANPDAKIFCFEDMIADPIQKLSEMFGFAGLELDAEAYRDIPLRDTNSTWAGEKCEHDVNTRWHLWTDDEVELFCRTVVPAFGELGPQLGWWENE